jgi:hypothetical protein
MSSIEGIRMPVSFVNRSGLRLRSSSGSNVGITWMRRSRARLMRFSRSYFESGSEATWKSPSQGEPLLITSATKPERASVLSPLQITLPYPCTRLFRPDRNHSSSPVVRRSSRPMIDVRRVRQRSETGSPRAFERP